MTQSTRNRICLVLVSLLALLNIAAKGTVTSLSASGGGNFNETITINATVRADAKVQNSNIYFEIRTPNGTVVATNSTSPPSLDAGQTFSYSWSTNNGGFPDMGNYTVTLCWSPGNSNNCGITDGPISTSFYSVPTFGGPLSLLALILVAGWFWRVRRHLAPAQGAVS